MSRGRSGSSRSEPGLIRRTRQDTNGGVMTDRSLDELGPVDYLIIEFPAGQQNFTGEGADELLRLHDAGIIRIMDILILQKAEDGTVMAQELGDLEQLGELGRLETELVQTLSEDDVD